MSLGLIVCGVMACDQILGNTDLEVEADSGSSDATFLGDSPATITNPVDVEVPVVDSGIDAGDATLYPDASLFPDAATVWLPKAGGNGHGYLVVVSGTIDWTDADAFANARGGHLVTITTAEENGFVAALAVDAGGWAYGAGPWMGGFQPPGSVEPDGGWSWITGEPWSYTSWQPGEPNNEGNENYLGFYGDAGGGWNDVAVNDGHVYAYVIEFE